jgi:hypothetical protein
MSSEWRCPECEKRGAIESDRVHGALLLQAIVDQHRELSPECETEVPVHFPGGFRPRSEWRPFLQQEIVALVEALEKEGELEPVPLAILKANIVWLDCQLGFDGESVEIANEIERLKARIDKVIGLANSTP